MTTFARRAALAATALATCGATALATSPGASAADLTMKYNATASTTIAKMGKTVVTTGTANTGVTLGTPITLSSDLKLAPVTTSALSLGSLPLAYATVAVEPTAPATGTIDLVNSKIAVNQKAYLHITKLTGPFQLANLVGSNCKTSTPVEMNLTGDLVSLTGPLKLSGSFTIPKFSGCGLFGSMNSIVSSQMSGTGNTVSLQLTPTA